MSELTPYAIRNATLTRRIRGYDRNETRQLLATVAENYDKAQAERSRLSKKVASLSRELPERETRSRAKVDALKEQVSERDRQIADLEAKIARFEKQQSEQLEELDRLREEISKARAVHEEAQAESRDQHERVARFALRERVLVEQIAMLSSHLDDEEATRSTSTPPLALPERTDRASATLRRLDRVVETLEQESRREAELTLKKARERADEIVRSAKVHTRHLAAETPHPPAVEEEEGAEEEYDPVAALDRIERPVSEPNEPDDPGASVGEAAWTSRAVYDDAPEAS